MSVWFKGQLWFIRQLLKAFHYASLFQLLLAKLLHNWRLWAERRLTTIQKEKGTCYHAQA
jgi:hypothetical protein